MLFRSVSPTNERAKGSFGFPALITALCAEHGVEVDPSEKIKLPMDARYIRQFCVNPAENPQAQQQPPSPPHVAEEQSMFYDKLSAIEASLQNLQLRQDHMMLQHSTTYKGIMYLEEGLYNVVPQGQYNQWMPPDQFRSYMAWPGDKPDFYGGVQQQAHLMLQDQMMEHITNKMQKMIRLNLIQILTGS